MWIYEKILFIYTGDSKANWYNFGNMVVCCKAEYLLTLQPRVILGETSATCTRRHEQQQQQQKKTFTAVWFTTEKNNWETTQMPINRKVDKQTVV